MDSKTLPDGYLDVCSIEALESLELARLNKAANLRDEMKEVLRRWVEAEVDAKLARWMLEKRRTLQFRAGRTAKLAPARAALGAPGRALLPTASFAVTADSVAMLAVRPNQLQTYADQPLAARPVEFASAPLQDPAAQIVSTRRKQDWPASVAASSRSSRATKTPRPERPSAEPKETTGQARFLFPNEAREQSTCAPGPAKDGEAASMRHDSHPDPESVFREVADCLPSAAAISAVAAIPGAFAQRSQTKRPRRRAAKALPTRALRARSPTRLLRAPDALRRRA